MNGTAWFADYEFAKVSNKSVLVDEKPMEAFVKDADPLTEVLDWLNLVPASDHEALFADFAHAVASKNLRTLLQTIADWASTGEVYAQPGMAEGILTARDAYAEEARWDTGR